MQLCHTLYSMHTLCYVIDVVKVCQLDLYHLYFDPYTKFNDPPFDGLKALESLTSKSLLMSWCEDLNGEEANCLIISLLVLSFL
jgi:hypothetical protein